MENNRISLRPDISKGCYGFISLRGLNIEYIVPRIYYVGYRQIFNLWRLQNSLSDKLSDYKKELKK